MVATTDSVSQLLWPIVLKTGGSVSLKALCGYYCACAKHDKPIFTSHSKMFLSGLTKPQFACYQHILIWEVSI